MTLSVAVSGASGYAGGEILRLLAAHPDVHIRTVTAHSNAGDALIQHQPHLRSLADLTLQPTTPEVLAGHDVVFLALPHGQSGQYTDALAETPLVIDAGADHRLTSPAAWDAFYGGAFHEPWTYGVPELIVGAGGQKQREHLVGASRIAAPGCNASTVALSLVPGVAAGVTARLVHAISARHGGAIAITHAAFATGCTFLRIGRHDPAQHRRTHQSCQHDPLEHGSSTFLIRGTAPLMISL